MSTLAIEIISRIRFIIDTKLTTFLGMLVLFAAGCALMFRSYRDGSSPIRVSRQRDGSSEDDHS